jgi:predicted phosphodiesterase
VISDVHANLAALEAVLEAIDDRAEEVWCLGDVVGYGPRPNECAEIVKDRCTLVLAGNHDLAACGRVDVRYFTPEAARAIRWTREVLRAAVETWLAALSPSADRGRVVLFHGSPADPVWEYILTAEAAAAALTATTADVVLVGHTHAALAAWLLDARLAGGRAGPAFELRLDDGRRALLNPGSVGQPRDADNRAAWLWLWLGDDGAPERCQFQRTRYDIARTQSEIVAAGLPQHLADRLSFGM